MQGNWNAAHLRRPTFLSELDSHDSESHSVRAAHNRARIMRKLKQLWHKQRYLTDDELESGREGQLDPEPPPTDTRPSKPPQKRLHQRQHSSEEEHLNLTRKKSNRHTVQSQEPSRESRDMEQLEQIAAFNSEVEDESR